MDNQCFYCQTTEKELRPYGPKGAWVCFPCAMASPEREAETGKQFEAQLDAVAAIGSVAVIGTEVGPHPIEHSVLAKKPGPAK